MWQTYRKRFWITQGFILAICGTLHFGSGTPWAAVGVFFAVMQVGAVAGAWWGTRLARKIQERQQDNERQ